ncbi:MAG TPA: FtsX-like permease family protein [Polyangiales bacterium]|nr:FtsX-like permease family protein [Polyangiales bacterium]
MNLRLFLRLLWREARGARARLAFVLACLSVGVAAVVGVAALVDAVELGIRARSRELLGGDLAIESRAPLPELDAILARELGKTPYARVDMSILSTMVRGERGHSRLAELKALDTSRGAFPLAGKLELSPPQPLAALLDDASVLVAPAILEEQGLHVGDALYVGGQRLIVRGAIVREPDPLTFSFAFGPRVLLTQAALERTSLLGRGHRARYRAVLRLPAETSHAELVRLSKALERAIPGGGTYVRVETHADAQPALRDTLERVQRYLSLLALLSLLIASVGVAQIVSTWLTQAKPQTAILRCLGFTPREVSIVYLGHVALLALLGSLLGAVFGAGLPALVARIYPELVPHELALRVPWGAVLRGCALGVGVSLVFSLPALSSVYAVSPARVLRAEATPLPVPRSVRLLAGASLLGGILLSAFAQAPQPLLAAGFAGGVTLTAALLWLGARGLLWSIGRLPRARLSPLVWQGAAALARPGAGAAGSIVALGMGSLAVLGIALVQGVLGREIGSALPAEAPSVFMVDVQPDQWTGVERALADAGAAHIQNVPVVMARLSAVDGRSVDELVRERGGRSDERANWVLTREQRVTSLAALPDSNHLVSGALWSKPGTPELSVEVDFARDIGVGLGSRLRFDVQGVPVEFEVTSLRKVEWRSFAVNFFLVAEPGTLDAAPQLRLAAARVPPRAEQELQDRLAVTYPNITLLRVRELLDRAAAIVAQLSLAVRLLGGFAAVTGLIILAGAVAASQLRRAREAALLKVLGLTRIQVAGMFALEYALAGAVAGAIAAAGAYALAWAFTKGVLDLASTPSLAACGAGWAITVVLSVLAGLAASVRALQSPPIAVFREQG